MSTPRLFLDAPLSEGAELPGTPAQAHHLGTVLRRGPGDAVAVFNPRDGEFAARIAALRKDRCAFAVEGRLRDAAPEPDLRLLVAAIKRDALDWVVEKATELGVSVIQPVLTRRSIVDRVNTDRLAAIARGAAEQCERLSVPRVAAALPLHAALDAWDGGSLFVAAERRGAMPLRHAVAGARLPVGWLVGPEGGFETRELDDVVSRPFVTAAALGPRILRAETAAVAGLAVLQALAGDWDGI
ncbi:16S rRNA (uracil(1498)-N(3))-methyltransferase [Roseomonas terrae]|jgi:16S rRNA (uracil1498-N3)-methyltransferase|uniref:Ribosomal RNA small subunit methyltransferase E n=1 Tax=Neoroseomonas terrae TaxID=424799 RepID=A0ABS5ENE9_9PROT|nr:16S rRNA (uracil(1498)-N(3))-methyltransferase [Neoroseomonas terrae]MBR0652562.1 16S rRNA (uracil(1498)-N(3))-methyltransferase [Neoroseomonas terrae]